MSEILQSSTGSGAGDNLFLSEELCDVEIFVRNKNKQSRFPAHRLVLSAQSPVFQTMLTSNFSEKLTGQIVVQDISPKIFKLVLRAIYQGKVTIETWQDGLSLLHAAHKYQIECLIEYCAKYLENILNIHNVCYIYNESCIYSLNTLKEKCIKLILDAGFIVLRSRSFEVLCKDAVIDIIKSPNLNIDNELIVFEALLKWATMERSRSGVPVTDSDVLLELSPFLKYVCFDDMSDTEKSALPPTVLSNVQPNNLCRIAPCIPDSLYFYSQCFNFSTDLMLSEMVSSTFASIRFSLDHSRYIIGLKIEVLASDLPHHLQLSIVKESAGVLTNVCNYNFAAGSCSWTDGLQIMDKKQFSTKVFFRQPFNVEPHTVHAIYFHDRYQNVLVNKSNLSNKMLTSEKNEVTISIHSECVWGITGLVLI